MTRPLRLLFLACATATPGYGLDFASDLALALKAPLHVAYFTDPQAADAHSAGPDPTVVPVGDSLGQCLDRQAARLRSKGLDVISECVAARMSAPHCVAYAQCIQADIIIKELTTQAQTLSPMDWELLSQSPVSVMYIQPGLQGAGGKVLAAVDVELPVRQQDNGNNATIGLAQYLANALEGSLDVVSVYDSAAHSAATASYETRQQAFFALAAQHDIAPAHRHFLAGTPASAVHSYLQRSHFDFLVIASANHATHACAIGTITEGLLKHAPCSVLVMKRSCLQTAVGRGKPDDAVEAQRSADAGSDVA
ncbi:universal stress protein [Pseudomonas sp. TE3610]